MGNRSTSRKRVRTANSPHPPEVSPAIGTAELLPITGQGISIQAPQTTLAIGHVTARINLLFKNPHRRALALVLVQHPALTWEKNVADNLNLSYKLLDDIAAMAPKRCESWRAYHREHTEESWALWTTVKKKLRESGQLVSSHSAK